MSHYKPYPAYKDSGVEWIGSVPEHWSVKRLRHVARFKNSNVDKKSYDGQQHVRLCNYTDVYYNEFINRNLNFMPSTASLDEIEQFSLKKGDVIITKDSEDPSDIGIPAIVSDDLNGVVCGYHLTLIRDNDFETSRIIHRALQAKPTQAHFFVEAPGVTRYGLNQDAIGDTPICLPPPQERKNLADHIDRETARIDALIAKKTRFIELLKEKRSALITHALTKGLDPSVKMKDSGVEWIGEVPEHWVIGRLSDFCSSISTGPFGTSLGVGDYVEDGIPVINPSHMIDGACVPDSLVTVSDATAERLAFWKLRAGDIVAARRGELGRAAIITNRECGWICGTGSLRLTPSPARVFPGYLYSVLQSNYARAWLDRESVGSTMPNLNESLIGRLPVTMPPSTSEQVTLLRGLDQQEQRVASLIANTKRSIDLLKERRSAFITAAVTGQIDLRESA
jgi:type I restriction enzyme S subunit